MTDLTLHDINDFEHYEKNKELYDEIFGTNNSVLHPIDFNARAKMRESMGTKQFEKLQRIHDIRQENKKIADVFNSNASNDDYEYKGIANNGLPIIEKKPQERTVGGYLKNIGGGFIDFVADVGDNTNNILNDLSSKERMADSYVSEQIGELTGIDYFKNRAKEEKQKAYEKANLSNEYASTAKRSTHGVNRETAYTYEKDVKAPFQKGNYFESLKNGTLWGIENAPALVGGILTAGNPVGLTTLGLSGAGQISETARENNDHEYKSFGDTARGVVTSAIATPLDKVIHSPKLSKSLLGSTAVEAGTEGLQGAIENIGGSVGTKRGFDSEEFTDEVVSNALLGGMGGAGFHLGRKAVDKYVQAKANQQNPNNPTPTDNIETAETEEITEQPTATQNDSEYYDSIIDNGLNDIEGHNRTKPTSNEHIFNEEIIDENGNYPLMPVNTFVETPYDDFVNAQRYAPLPPPNNSAVVGKDGTVYRNNWELNVALERERELARQGLSKFNIQEENENIKTGGYKEEANTELPNFFALPSPNNTLIADEQGNVYNKNDLNQLLEEERKQKIRKRDGLLNLNAREEREGIKTGIAKGTNLEDPIINSLIPINSNNFYIDKNGNIVNRKTQEVFYADENGNIVTKKIQEELENQQLREEELRKRGYIKQPKIIDENDNIKTGIAKNTNLDNIQSPTIEEPTQQTFNLNDELGGLILKGTNKKGKPTTEKLNNAKITDILEDGSFIIQPLNTRGKKGKLWINEQAYHNAKNLYNEEQAKIAEEQAKKNAPLDFRMGVKQEQQPTQLQQPRTQQTKNALIGKQSYTLIKGKREPTQLKVVEAKQLTADLEGGQFRETNDPQRQVRIEKMANDIQPTLLDDIPSFGNSAPILDNQGKVILNGNTRTLAIKKAYENNNRGANEYKQHLINNAEKYGLTKEQISNMQQPVLVRELLTDKYSNEEIALLSNEEGVAQTSAYENTKADIHRLPKNITNIKLNAQGRILDNKTNIDILNSFLANFPESVRNGFKSNGGIYNNQLLERLNNALLFSAYGDTAFTREFIENPDLDLKKAVNALASQSVSINNAKKANNSNDISEEIAKALTQLQMLLGKGINVDDYIKNHDLFKGDEKLKPISKSFIKFINDNLNNKTKIAKLIKDYYAILENSTRTDNLFDNETQTKEDILNQALQQGAKQYDYDPKAYDPKQWQETTDSPKSTTNKGTSQNTNGNQQRPKESQSNEPSVKNEPITQSEDNQTTEQGGFLMDEKQQSKKAKATQGIKALLKDHFNSLLELKNKGNTQALNEYLKTYNRLAQLIGEPTLTVEDIPNIDLSDSKYNSAINNYKYSFGGKDYEHLPSYKGTKAFRTGKMRNGEKRVEKVYPTKDTSDVEVILPTENDYVLALDGNRYIDLPKLTRQQAKDIVKKVDEVNKYYDVIPRVLAQYRGYKIVKDTRNLMQYVENQNKAEDNQPVQFSKVAKQTAKQAEEKNLYVAHNLSDKNVIFAHELGGLPAPSIAIARSDVSDFDMFGNITLLAEPSLIEDMPTYNTDIHSPRQPKIHYKINHNKFSTLENKLKKYKLTQPNEFDLIEIGLGELMHSSAMKALFLESINKLPKLKKSNAKVDNLVVKASKDLENIDIYAKEFFQNKVKDLLKRKNKDYTSRFFDEKDNLKAIHKHSFQSKVDDYNHTKGYDYNQYEKDITDKINKTKKTWQEYQEWTETQFKEIVDGKYFGDGESIADYNIANIVKNMTATLSDENLKGNASSIRSKYAKELKTLRDIKNNRNEIISNEEFEVITEQSEQVIDETISALKPFYKGKIFDDNSYQEEIRQLFLFDINTLKESFNINSESEKIINDFVNYFSEIPTKYFEVKAQRAVTLDEFKVAVVPQNADPKAVKILRDAGLTIRRYDDSKEGKSRKEVIAKQNKIFFNKTKSKKTHTRISKIEFNKIVEILVKPFQALLPNLKVIHNWNEFNQRYKALTGKELSEIQFMKAWHGSPHSFNEFSTDYMGSGEGAQVYGWGLYFTDKEEIARSYAENNTYTVRGYDYYDIPQKYRSVLLDISKHGIDGTITKIEEYISDYDGIDMFSKGVENNKDRLNWLKSNKDKIVKNQNLYQVKIHGDKTIDELNFMRWDKRASDDNIKLINNGLKNLGEKTRRSKNKITVIHEGYTDEIFLGYGSDLYYGLKKYFGNDKKASLFLLENGIDGIQYPTEYLSDSSDKGTYNYVVFDDTAVEIDKHIQFMRTNDGIPYGAKLSDGTIFIDDRYLNANTPIHEFSHLWEQFMPKQWKKGLEIFKKSSIGQDMFDKLKEEGLYEELSDEQLWSEALNTHLGNYGEWQYHASKEPKSIMGRLKTWFDNAIKQLGNYLTNKKLLPKGFRLTPNTQLEVFSNKVLKDLMSGKPLKAEKQANNKSDMQLSQQEQAEMAEVRRKYQGTDQWLKAPNGEDTNLTERQWLQVRTPSFKKWFGDWENDPYNASEIVDSNREPKVVYHYTSDDFNTFDLNKSDGFWFTDLDSFSDEIGANGSGTRKAVFLNIRDGYVGEDSPNYDIEEFMATLEDGEDGLIHYYDGFTDYTVINPNQIKSATDNIGTFDPNNNDIRYSKGDSKQERIEKLKADEPLILDSNAYKGKYELDPKSADKWIKNNLRKSYTIPDTNETIDIVAKSAEEVLSHNRYDEAHLRSIAHIPSFIKNAIFIDEQPNRKRNGKFDSYRYYVLGIKLDGVDYTVKMVVGVKHGKKYYDHQLTQIEKTKLIDQINQSAMGFTPTGDAPIPSYAEIKDSKLVEILQVESPNNQVQFSKRTEDEPLVNPFGSVNSVEQFMQRLKLGGQQYTDKMRIKFQDRFLPIYRLQQAIKDNGGKLEIGNNVYLAEERYQDKVTYDADRIKVKFIDPLIKGLAKYKISQDELDEFLMMRHAPERNQYLLETEGVENGSGISTKKAEKYLADIKKDPRYNAFVSASKVVYKMVALQRHFMKKGGLVDENTVDEWQDRYKYYVPLKGTDKKAKGFWKGFATGKGYDIRGKEVHKAKGRKTMAKSPTAQVIADLSDKAIRMRKNEVAQHLKRLMLDNPNAELWQVTDKIPTDENYIGVKENGKQHYLIIKDEDIFNAIKDLSVVTPNYLISIARWTRRLSALNTSLNPDFIATNIARDVQTALLNLEAEQTRTDGKAFGKKLTQQVVKDLAKRKAYKAIKRYNQINGLSPTVLKYDKPPTAEEQQWLDYYEEFQQVGAKTGFVDMKSVEEQYEHIQKSIQQQGGGFKNKAMRNVSAINEWVEATNSNLENITRLTAYVNARKAGISKEMAGSLAKNLTVNFKRKGQVSGAINALYMFANASVQGTSNFMRTMYGLKGEGVTGLNKAQKIGLGLVAVGAILAEVNRYLSDEDDDEELFYDKIPDYIKERNFILMLGNGKDYITVPKPYGYSVFPYLGEKITEVAHGKTKPTKASWQVTKSLMFGFSPIPIKETEQGLGTFAFKNAIPSIGAPFADVILFNEKFTGSPIHTEQSPYQPHKANAYMGRDTTNDFFKMGAKFLNTVSLGDEYHGGKINAYPEDLKYLAEQYTGGAGRFWNIKIIGGAEKLATNSVEKIEPRDYPILSRFYGEYQEYGDIQKFYDRKDEIEIVHRKYKEHDKNYLTDKEKKQLALYSKAQAVAKAKKNISTEIYKIKNNDKLTNDEKRKKIDKQEERLCKKIDDFNKSYNRQMEKVEKKK